MGLPNKWTDPHYGVCLSLWAAVAHLKTRGATCITEKNAIRFTLGEGTEQRIEAVYIAAAGWMFPMTELEK